MKTNATHDELNSAMALLNEQYNDNVMFNRFDQQGSRYNFTLRVKDSSGKGARRGFHNNRKMVSACWHTHGHFFECLFKTNPEVWVKSSFTGKITKDHGNWQDKQVGSGSNPFYLSEMCEC